MGRALDPIRPSGNRFATLSNIPPLDLHSTFERTSTLVRALLGALTPLAVIVSLLIGAPRAGAEPVGDGSRTYTTRDGWVLTVSKTAENLTRVPNMATTMLTREGFVSADFDAEISGTGTTPLRGASLTAAFQIGCQIDMSNGVVFALGGTIGPYINGQGMVSQSPSAGVGVGVGASVSPSITVPVRPGSITTLVVATKPLARAHASVHVEEINIKADGCGGLTSIRAIATISASSDDQDTQITAYGQPVWL